MKENKSTKSTIILGFFDGIHVGHRAVINSAVNFAKENNSKTILLTFPKSPAEYFNSKTEYIFQRDYNYKIIKSLGVDLINETEFSSLITITAEDYLKEIVDCYSPNAIFSGFNYTFGANRSGNPAVLEKYQTLYNYKYFCINPIKINENTVSSTLIKKHLSEGNMEKAEDLLHEPFLISSDVIEGAKIGRTIGFPTANMIYPHNIVRIPYGVYKAKVLGKDAIINWGIKPTLNGKAPVLEVHIPDFSGNLYGKTLDVQILKKIRNEKKFESINELKEQIKKDLEICSEL